MVEFVVPQQFIANYFSTMHGLMASEKIPHLPPPNKVKREIKEPEVKVCLY